GEGMVYEDERVRVSFSNDLKVEGMDLLREFYGEMSLLHVAEMVTVLRGVEGSLPFLSPGE
ncbi:hypothetical protein J7K60_02760, partial [Candidatus Bipolaricaulota bacterium]|nr:hypothetical protein [Candidatus Bipolaricaulota bacterium]